MCALTVLALGACTAGGSSDHAPSGSASVLRPTATVLPATSATGVGILQEHSVDVVSGDPLPQGRDGKVSHHAYVAWPTRPTEGSSLILWMAVDGDMSNGDTAALAAQGWDQAVFAMSPDDAAGLAVYLRRAAADEPLVVDLPSGVGERIAAGLMEWSGLGDLGGVVAEGFSNTQMTTGVHGLPAQSITPAEPGGVVIHVGAVLDFRNDGSKRLADVSYGGAMTTVHIARNQGERRGSGTYFYGAVGFAGFAENVVGPIDVSPTLTWSGEGTDPAGTPLGAEAMLSFHPGTPAKHAVMPASSFTEVSHASGQSTDGSVEISLPVPARVGDLLVAYGASDRPLGDSAGWTRVETTSAPDAALWWRLADGSEPDPFRFDAPGSSVLVAGVAALRGPTKLDDHGTREITDSWDAPGVDLTPARGSLVFAVTTFGFASFTVVEQFANKCLPTLGSWTAGLHDSTTASPAGLQGTGHPFIVADGGGSSVTARFGLTEASYGGPQAIRYLHDWWLEGRPSDPYWSPPRSGISAAVLAASFS